MNDVWLVIRNTGLVMTVAASAQHAIEHAVGQLAFEGEGKDDGMHYRVGYENGVLVSSIRIAAHRAPDDPGARNEHGERDYMTVKRWSVLPCGQAMDRPQMRFVLTVLDEAFPEDPPDVDYEVVDDEPEVGPPPPDERGRDE